MELDYHHLLARDLELLSQVEFDQLALEVNEVRRMLASFMYRLAPDR